MKGLTWSSSKAPTAILRPVSTWPGREGIWICIQNIQMHTKPIGYIRLRIYTSPSSVATSKEIGFPPVATKAWQSPFMQANTAPMTKHAGRTYGTVDSWEKYGKNQTRDPTSSFLEMMNSQKDQKAVTVERLSVSKGLRCCSGPKIPIQTSHKPW